MALKNIIIIGAGGFGREVHGYLFDVLKHNPDWKFKGFLDDDVQKFDQSPQYGQIIGTLADYEIKQDDRFIIAIGSPTTKMKVAELILERGGNFINLIHPTAYVSQQAKLGVGIVACPFSMILPDTTIGDFVMLNVHATIGHDAIVERGCTLSGHADVTGYAHLEEQVFIGSHGVITPKMKVGKGAVVGAGSVVMHRIKAGQTVYGNPAKRLQQLR